MRYFTCKVCGSEDVGQSEMSPYKAAVCENCREAHPNESKQLDDRAWQEYRQRKANCGQLIDWL